MDGDTARSVETRAVDAVAVPVGGNGRGTARDPSHDVEARRADIVVRLLERGMSARVLRALLPGWDEAIRTAAPPGSSEEA